MRNYIFRKYTGYNAEQIECWSNSSMIDTSKFSLDSIALVKGGAKAGTSIPSPLARLELFETAFQIVSSTNGNLTGTTIYHRLVSDCFDLFQLLFNIKQVDIGSGKKLRFKEWRAMEQISRLKERGSNHAHYLLGRSLEQIFNDDFNPGLKNVDSLFLIYYDDVLIGGTSPLTFLFTSPNLHRYLQDGKIRNIPQSSDGVAFFGEKVRSLHERDEEFVKYIYKLSQQYKSAFSETVGFRKYVNKVVDEYFPSLRNQFENYGHSSSEDNRLDNEYVQLNTRIDSRFLTINGLYFFSQKEENEKEKIKSVSDFIIRASETKYRKQYNILNELQSVEPPLVIFEGMNYPGDYMDKHMPWDSSTKIRDYYFKGEPVFSRKLPHQNTLTDVLYPWITTEDFLEEYLVEMPFNLNQQMFYTGFEGDFKYLLPIKKEYFDYFSIDDLKRNLSIRLEDKKIEIELRIPVKNKKGVQSISFRKEYKKGVNVVEYRAALGIFPFHKITDETLKKLNEYKVLLADHNDGLSNLSLQFHKYDNIVANTTGIPSKYANRSTIQDVKTNNSNSVSKFYSLEDTYDYIILADTEIAGRPTSGMIIPKFENRNYNRNNLNNDFIVSIDFGTSNTHVAYLRKGDPLPKSFDITDTDQQMVLLNEPLKNSDRKSRFEGYGQASWLDLTLRREFVPAVIGSDENIEFPFRTATCEIAGFKNEQEKRLFNHINIGFHIEKEEIKTNSVHYKTNLKWLLENNNDDANTERVRFFLMQLMLMIRSKVILNNGNPDTLKIVWSVPHSMERGNKTKLKSIFNQVYSAVFPDLGKLSDPIPESVAPYFYLTKSDADIQNTANVINVDIGGGTTDVMMFMESAGNRTDKYLATSFRFGGNELWGNGYGNGPKSNGFIRNHEIYREKNNLKPAELKYFNKAEKDPDLNTDDLVSVLFKYPEIKFIESIVSGKPDLLVILYLHYSAIIYHLVQIIELKEYPLPRYLSFTGKGSQYLRMLCGGDTNELVEFTKLLLKTYTSKAIQNGFTIHLNKNPKEITAYGAIMFADEEKAVQDQYNSIDSFIFPGFDTSSPAVVSEKLKKAPDSTFTIEETIQIDSDLNVAILNNINRFLEITLKNKEIARFLKEYKINSVQQTYDLMVWDRKEVNGSGFVYDSYKKVLKNLHLLDSNDELPESMFFYAFKDSLYRLSNEISPKS